MRSGVSSLWLRPVSYTHLPDVDDLGLQAGRRYHLTTYGAWGYAILSSATVRQAAELGLRYHGLTYAFTRISLSLDDAIASLHFDDSALPPALHDFIVQRDMLGALAVSYTHLDVYKRQGPGRQSHCR